jgi:hypothetical protein
LPRRLDVQRGVLSLLIHRISQSAEHRRLAFLLKKTHASPETPTYR